MSHSWRWAYKNERSNMAGEGFTSVQKVVKIAWKLSAFEAT